MDDLHPDTSQRGATDPLNSDLCSIPTCIEYRGHQLLAAEKREVLNFLPDGNNEVSISKINDEFAERQQADATVLLSKTAFLRDGILASGIPFDGRLRISSIKMSECGGSTLVILDGIPLDQKNKPLHDTPIELAVTNETYILYIR